MSAQKDDGHIRLIGALAGVGSGLTKVVVGHGFDTVKTRLQCTPRGTYRDAFDCLGNLIRSEGVLALYKGATPPAVGWAAIDSVLLGSLHNYRLYLVRNRLTEPTPGSDVQRLTLFGHGIAGLGAGLTSAIVATPIEHIKVKLQIQLQKTVSERQFKSPVDCIRQVVRTQGITGLWMGFTGSLAFRSNFFWMFLSFEALMRGFTSLRGTPYEISTGAANFLSGGLGSFAFWAMAIPADNIKNRMMSFPYPRPYSALSGGSGALESRPSFVRTMLQIFSEHGVAGFYRGLGPCLLRAFPVNACAFFVFEGTMRLLGAEKTRH